MKRFSKILCIALVALLLAAVFAGCNNTDKDALDLTVEIVSMSGEPIQGVAVDVLKDGKSVASGRTNADGKFAFKAAAATYEVNIADLPSNYQMTNDGTFAFEASDKNKALKLEFVDLSLTNFTVSSVGGARLEGVTVTLSLGGNIVDSGETNHMGIVAFDVDPADYTYAVSNLPNGYYFADPADATGQTETKNMIELKFPSQVTAQPRTDRLYREGDIFFDFEIKDAIEGKNYKLSELLTQKKMVLINFWNTACAPCVGEMPGLSSAYEEYQDTVQVLAVSSILFAWNTEQELRNFASQNALSFPLFADSTDGVYFYQYLGLNALPTNVVIDRYGMVAMMSSSSSGTDVFLKMFAKYTADDYVQDTAGVSGGGSEDQPERERVEPTVTQEDSASIKAAINGEGFDGEWYPESGTEDAKYSWPWAVDTIREGGQDVKVLKPTNHFVDYSFATIKTKVNITRDMLEDMGQAALVFDLKYSTELWCDYFYVIIAKDGDPGNEVYSYTGTEHWTNWQRCYALVADEPGEYELTLLFNKDDMNAGGEDTVYVKNVRLISSSEVNGETESLDMPRDAVREWNANQKKFDKRAPAVMGTDGFYHYNDENGPYLLANLYSRGLPFHIARGYERTVSEAVMGSLFKDAQGNDMADEITQYLIAANNSELASLTVVTEELKNMLNAFAQALYPECDDTAWLEFCIWFEHYGTDPSDRGISDFDRNPVRGLMKRTAIPMAQVHQGMFADLTEIEDQYKNKVVVDRVIMPRGIMYKITPTVSGAYRFRSQSARLNDTTAWLRDENMDVNSVLTEFGEEREDPDADYNFVITWYLEKDKTYYLSVSMADVGGTGEFTFTTEYLGASFYSWQAVSRAIVTFDEGENGEMGALRNYYNAYPVLADDDMYYDAVRGEDGTPVRDAQGNLIPDKNDPIYVDFFHGTRFMEQSLDSIIEMGKTQNILKRLREEILPNVFAAMPSNVQSGTPLPLLNNGNALEDATWDRLAAAITASYGETVSFDDETFAELKKCMTVSDIINKVLKPYYLTAFDFTGYRGQVMYHLNQDGDLILGDDGQPVVTQMWEYLGVSEEDLKSFTNDIERFRDLAKAKTTADHSEPEYGGEGFDAGCLHLSKDLCTILKLFAQRYGWTGLQTDWMRLCYHYEYIGPYQG